jgi:hypothetical protein
MPKSRRTAWAYLFFFPYYNGSGSEAQITLKWWPTGGLERSASKVIHFCASSGAMLRTMPLTRMLSSDGSIAGS